MRGGAAGKGASITCFVRSNWIVHLWRGEMSLPVTFWLIWFLPSVLGALVQRRWVSGVLSPSEIILMIVAAIATLSFHIFCMIAIWRSAGKYAGPAIWKYLARGTILYLVIATCFLGRLDLHKQFAQFHNAALERLRMRAMPGPLPKRMTRAVIVWTTTNMPHAPYAERPRTYTNASDRYCRQDFERDPLRNTQQLVIMNEPDWWDIDLVAKVARHSVDPELPFVCFQPVFNADEEKLNPVIGELDPHSALGAGAYPRIS
ncbi:MAG: hypothetical protein HKL90_10540 [Elusimicrobia bacterium]|nr:hypothetical protein [Elusimicrobiota bacterium]